VLLLNRIQGLILATFKDLMPQDVVLELHDLRHTLDLDSEPYIRITSDDILLF